MINHLNCLPVALRSHDQTLSRFSSASLLCFGMNPCNRKFEIFHQYTVSCISVSRKYTSETFCAGQNRAGSSVVLIEMIGIQGQAQKSQTRGNAVTGSSCMVMPGSTKHKPLFIYILVRGPEERDSLSSWTRMPLRQQTHTTCLLNIGRSNRADFKQRRVYIP